MRIQVLGSGCSTCGKLKELTLQAVKELELDTKVEYITDIEKIIEMGVMQIPVLAIDGKPVLTGKGFTAEKIKEIIKNSL